MLLFLLRQKCLIFQDGADAHELAGLAKGGQQIKRLKVNYGKTDRYFWFNNSEIIM
jgi:hypothetical protein